MAYETIALGFEDKIAVISERDGKMHTRAQLATGIESFRTTAPNFFTERSTTARDLDPSVNIRGLPGLLAPQPQY